MKDSIRLALLTIIIIAIAAGAQKLTTTQPTTLCDTTTITNCATVTSGALATNAATNVQNIGGNAVAVTPGDSSTETQRVVLASDQPNFATPLNVSLGTANVNQNLVNLSGNPVATVGAGVQKVAIFDSTGLPIQATADPCSSSLTALIAASITADT